MATAKVFKSGNSQAVRLPKGFRLDATEVGMGTGGDEEECRPEDGTHSAIIDGSPGAARTPLRPEGHRLPHQDRDPLPTPPGGDMDY